ncbi:MAG: biotin-dependent carboxyltransferase family protein [Nocardioides sp.]|nr:biotin-dependent carboxyltransferase family protein [Nocardioides sp.]
MGRQTRSVTITARGPQVLVQDSGRPGYAHLGVAAAGAADAPSYSLANRLVGNAPGTACLEVTLGGLELTVDHTTWVAVTGAPTPVTVGGRAFWVNQPVPLRAGQTLRLGTPSAGLRSYVAIRGGFRVDQVLESCSADTMSGLGPPPLEVGDVLEVDRPAGPVPSVDSVPRPGHGSGPVMLDAVVGPRADWFVDGALKALFESPFEVTSDANRVGVRLSGPPLPRRDRRELSSEGVVCGSLQAPPGGRVTLFLADHPVTGGYPVIAVLRWSSIPAAAQLRPGQAVCFRRVRE